MLLNQTDFVKIVRYCKECIGREPGHPIEWRVHGDGEADSGGFIES